MPNPLPTFIPGLQDSITAIPSIWSELSEILETSIDSALDLNEITRHGLSPVVMEKLVEQGFSRSELNWIVPPRTLNHRRNKGERLTIEESSRWLRVAKLYFLSTKVMGNNQKADQWLRKPRKRFNNLSAMKLMQTEVGAQLVEETLMQLDSGYFA